MENFFFLFLQKGFQEFALRIFNCYYFKSSYYMIFSFQKGKEEEKKEKEKGKNF